MKRNNQMSGPWISLYGEWDNERNQRRASLYQRNNEINERHNSLYRPDNESVAAPISLRSRHNEKTTPDSVVNKAK